MYLFCFLAICRLFLCPPHTLHTLHPSNPFPDPNGHLSDPPPHPTSPPSYTALKTTGYLPVGGENVFQDACQPSETTEFLKPGTAVVRGHRARQHATARGLDNVTRFCISEVRQDIHRTKKGRKEREKRGKNPFPNEPPPRPPLSPSPPPTSARTRYIKRRGGGKKHKN